ncbi:hypothetical protein [Ornithinimicrobium kibberense]|uniref:hypothetical protein n=1 Tax=Ornithinimicrobium kibberense TaxID=282060 RepID=UPI00361275E8
MSGARPEVEHREPRRGDVPHSQADNASLRTLFPNVEPVSLEQGLGETLAWFQQELPAIRAAGAR